MLFIALLCTQRVRKLFIFNLEPSHMEYKMVKRVSTKIKNNIYKYSEVILQLYQSVMDVWEECEDDGFVR